MSRRRSARNISALKETDENSPRKSSKKSKKGLKETPRPLATLQLDAKNPNQLVGGSKTPNRHFTKKPERIGRSMSPLLPEISLAINKEGMFEVEKVPQEVVSTQTEPMKTEDKGTQTDDLAATDIKQSEATPEESIDYQLCCSDPPPPLYWEQMAEKRRVALTEVLDENEVLWKEIESLKEIIEEGERQRNNALYFQFMYKLVAEETKQLN